MGRRKQKTKKNNAYKGIIEITTFLGVMGGLYIPSKIGMKIIKSQEYHSFKDVTKVFEENMLLLFGSVLIGGAIGYIVGKMIVGFLKLIFK